MPSSELIPSRASLIVDLLPAIPFLVAGLFPPLLPLDWQHGLHRAGYAVMALSLLGPMVAARFMLQDDDDPDTTRRRVIGSTILILLVAAYGATKSHLSGTAAAVFAPVLVYVTLLMGWKIWHAAGRGRDALKLERYVALATVPLVAVIGAIAISAGGILTAPLSQRTATGAPPGAAVPLAAATMIIATTLLRPWLARRLAAQYVDFHTAVRRARKR